jgi:hypothetical protein
MGGVTASDALQYTQGVDRSPTEVAALAAADGHDPVAFLVDACGLVKAEATAAVALLGIPAAKPAKADPKPTKGAPASEPAEG